MPDSPARDRDRASFVHYIAFLPIAYNNYFLLFVFDSELKGEEEGGRGGY